MSSSSYSYFCFVLLLLFTSSLSVVVKLEGGGGGGEEEEEEGSLSELCRATPHPRLCHEVLLPINGTADPHQVGRYSVRHSLYTSRRFLSLLYRLSRSTDNAHYSLPLSSRRAIDDCIQLSHINTDFLIHSFGEVNSTTGLLSFSRASLVQSLLSAIITNQDTCLDSLHSLSLSSRLPSQFHTITQLYSVSLALVTHAWVPKKKPTFRSVKGRKKKKKKVGGWWFMSQVVEDERGVGGGVEVGEVLVVEKNGGGNFRSINEAVDAAANNTDGRNGYSVIYVKAGVYEEYVSIPKNKNYLMMIGDGIGSTIITGSRSVVDGWTTYNSATFAVVGPMFVAMNMTIRNTAGAVKEQAVALRNNADLSVFYRCSIEGYQDTLYAHSLRQFYRECDIHGTVDFIFGNAAVVLQGCNLYVRRPMEKQYNAITAQGRTDPNQNTGISIMNSRVRAAPEMEKVNEGGVVVESYLGRPWKPFSRTVYMQSAIDGFINPAGWREWSGNTSLDTLYYGEFLNTGRGSDTSHRVTWPGYYHFMHVADALNFTPAALLLAPDWIPHTGVPFSPGLLPH